MSKTLSQINFLDILPPSIAGDDQIKAAAQALDTEIQKLNAEINNIFIWSRWDEIEEPLISTLAHQLHVDYWDDDFSIEEKRDMVRRSIAMHRIKGTPAAVEYMLDLIIGGGDVVEWFQYGGEPYFFRIITTESLGGPDTFEKKLIPAIDRAKNTRSWLEKIIVKRETRTKLDFNFGMIKKSTMKLGPAFYLKPVERRFIGVIPQIGTRLKILAA